MQFFSTKHAHKMALVGFHAQSMEDSNVIVLDFDMSLTGPTLDSAPDFIRRIYAIVAREECGVRKVSSKTDIAGVDMEMYKLDPDDKMLKNDGAVLLTLSKTVLNKLAISRPNKPFVLASEIKLHFSLAYGWEPTVWRWAQDTFSTVFWCKFSGRQIEFVAGKENDDEAAQPVLDAMANLAAPIAEGDGITSMSIIHDGKELLKIDKPAAERIMQRAGRKKKGKGKAAAAND